MYGFRLDF